MVSTLFHFLQGQYCLQVRQTVFQPDPWGSGCMEASVGTIAHFKEGDHRPVFFKLSPGVNQGPGAPPPGFGLQKEEIRGHFYEELG